MQLIRTETEYEVALKRLETLFGSAAGTPEGDLLEALSILVESYEDEHYPIPPPDPAEAIKYFRESRGL